MTITRRGISGPTVGAGAGLTTGADRHVRFDMDKGQAVASRKRGFDLIAADRIPFTGYHMPFAAVGDVEKQDLGYRPVPVSYWFSL